MTDKTWKKEMIIFEGEKRLYVKKYTKITDRRRRCFSPLFVDERKILN